MLYFADMMRKTLFSLILLSCVIGLRGQTVEWSNQQKMKSKLNYTQVLGENAAGVFIVRSRNSEFIKDLTLEKYKPNLALEFSKDLYQPQNSIVERVIIQESGLLLFTSQKNQTENKIELYCTRLDDAGNPQPNPTLMLQVDAATFKGNTHFYIRAAADKSKYSVGYFTLGAEKNTSVFHLIGYNATMVKTFKRDYQMKDAIDDIVLTSIECDNEGNVFTLLDFPKDPKKTRTTDPRKFFLYAFFAASDNMLEYELGNDSIFINELGLAVNNFAKSVAVCGFYSYKNDNNVAGDFYYSISATTTMIETKSFEDYSKGFVSKIAGSMQNENGFNISDLYIRKIIPRSDGGCLVIAEKFYETKQAYTYYVNGFPQTSYRSIYNYDEIVVTSRNKDGSTQFRNFVKKQQSSLSDGGYYSSFVTMLGNDRIGLIYNSDVSNDSDVMLTTVSNKGLIDTKVLIKSMSYYVSIMPPESKQVSAGSAVIGALKDKRFCLMRLSY